MIRNLRPLNAVSLKDKFAVHLKVNLMVNQAVSVHSEPMKGQIEQAGLVEAKGRIVSGWAVDPFFFPLAIN